MTCMCEWTQEQLAAELRDRFLKAARPGMTIEEAKPLLKRAYVVFELERQLGCTREYAEEFVAREFVAREIP